MARKRSGSIVDYGAVSSDVDPGYDVYDAFTAAFDDLGDAAAIAAGMPNPYRAALYVPRAQWSAKTMIPVPDNITIYGDDELAEVDAGDTINPFLFGVRPAAAWAVPANFPGLGPTFAANHRIDAFGKLDTSMASAAGQAWGVTTHSASNTGIYADHFLSFWGVPPATGVGDAWATTNTLTVEWLIEGPAGGPPCAIAPGAGGVLCGMGDVAGPSPWHVDFYYEPADGTVVYRVTFRTAQGVRNVADSPRTFRFGSFGVASWPCRAGFTVNLGAVDASTGLCRVVAWQDCGSGPVSVPVVREYGTGRTTATTTEPSFVPADLLSFRANERAPFKVGATTDAGLSFGLADATQRGNFNLYGLMISSQDDTILTPGLGPDSYRFGGVGRPGMVARLVTSTAPVAGWKGRHVRMQGGAFAGGASFCGLFMPDQGDLVSPAVTNTGVRGLAVVCQNHFNVGIGIGQVIGFECSGVASSNGWIAIGSLGAGAAYDLWITDVVAEGMMYGIFLNQNIAVIRGMRRANIGSALVCACGSRLQLVSAKGGGYVRDGGTIVRIVGDPAYAASYWVEDIETDNETPTPRPSVVVDKCNADMLVALTNISVETRGVGPDVVFNDPHPDNGVGYYSITGPNAGTIRVAAFGTWTRVPDVPVPPLSI